LGFWAGRSESRENNDGHRPTWEVCPDRFLVLDRLFVLCTSSPHLHFVQNLNNLTNESEAELRECLQRSRQLPISSVQSLADRPDMLELYVA
jgi:hypothetical protein